jgi:Protein of unknown function (DUF3800)
MTGAGVLPQLRNLADVPLFADSRASRLLQAADLVSYALYRHYDPARGRGEDYVGVLWPRFDAVDGVMHGCVHFTPSFRLPLLRLRAMCEQGRGPAGGARLDSGHRA